MPVKDGLCTQARWAASPNCGERPPGVPVDLVVVHNISLPPGQFGGGYVEQFFQNRLNHDEHEYFETIRGLEVSAHLFIERDGSLVQFVNFNQRAWHAGISEWQGRVNCNDFSIGIELEGTDVLPYTEAQYAALAEVIRDLVKAYPDLKREGITGHADIAPGRKTDPGPAFDWGKLQEYLSRRCLPV